MVNPEKLTQQLIPRFFKHSNYSSFVRQLNMYGFRKITHITQGSLKQEDPEWMEFTNDNFVRGKPELLQFMKRKTASNRNKMADMEAGGAMAALMEAGYSAKVPDIQTVLRELSTIKQTQHRIQDELRLIHAENEHIWKESQVQRLKHENQQAVINKVCRRVERYIH